MLVSEGPRLLDAGADGTSQTQLLGDSAAGISDVSSCGARHIVFAWAFHGGTVATNIWLANRDGSSPTKLTYGHSDLAPVCSPDEKWVYYFNQSANQLWRVPRDGSGKGEMVPGTAVQHAFVAGPIIDLSPDGKTLLYLLNSPVGEAGLNAIALLDLGAAASPRLLNANPSISGGGLRFTRDGKSVAYSIQENGVDNIWVQPVDGSPGRKITNFNADQIAQFDWSPDGKSLGIVRVHTDSDVVMLQEAKP